MNQPQLPTLFFAHSNGFPARCYDPFLEKLAPFPVDYVAELGKDHPHPTSWQVLADEVIQAIEQRQSAPVVGLGHSFGGVAIFWAARQRPDLFSRIVVMDPPLFGWQRRVPVAFFQFFGLAHKVVPPAQKALRRRDRFASKAEAKTYWAAKQFFKDFDPASMNAYVEHGLVEDGQGVTLRVPRQQESRFFAAMPTRIGRTTLPLPAHYVVPSGEGVSPKSHQRQVLQKFPTWQWHEVPGNHMFPLEYPTETAEFVKGLL